jgi:ligand-binding sensor domain-containing protein
MERAWTLVAKRIFVNVMPRPLPHISLILLLHTLGGMNHSHAQPPRSGFEHFSMEQGLPSNDISNILFDHEGYLWATTQNGLSRYDGYTFSTYKFDPHDSGSLNNNLCIALYEDKAGNIWVGTIEGGINRFDRKTGKFINYRPPQPPGRFETVLRAVSVINEDKFGYFWIGSSSGELRRFDKATGRFSPSDIDLGYRVPPGDPRPFDRINCIYRDSRQDIWVCNRTGLHRLVLSPGKPFDTATVRIRHYRHDDRDTNSLSTQEAQCAFEDHAGRFWVSTDSGLDLLDRQTGHFTHYSMHHSTPNTNGKFYGSISEDNEHNLWVGSFDGIYRFDSACGFEHFQRIPDDPNSLHLSTCKLTIDKADNIWVNGWGIDKLDTRQVPLTWLRHDPLDRYSITDRSVAKVCADRNGTLWIANGMGLEARDKKTGRFRHYVHDDADPASLSDNATSSVLEDEEGLIWVTSWKGTVDRLDPQTGRFTHYIGPRGKFKNVGIHQYHAMCLGPGGVLWIAEASSGVTALNYHTDKLTHFGHEATDPGGLSDWTATSVCTDDEGFIWVGHGSVATDRLDPRTGRCRHYQYRPADSNGISSNYVNAILNDHRGSLWLGTLGGGLCRYQESTGLFRTYTEKDGLLDNDVNSILQDDAGNIWLGTAKGICRYTQATNAFTNFDYLNAPRNDQSASLRGKGPDGSLFFIDGDPGLKSFDPSRLHPNRYIPPIVLTRFNLLDGAQPFAADTGEIRLRHDQNFFSFEFSALNYTAARRNQYAYMLEGLDKNWVFCRNRHVATYTNIPPGEYTFRVIGSNNSGLWNNDGITLHLVVSPPWWRTWWAWTLYALGALAIVFFLDRKRKRSLVEKARQRNLAKELEMQALRAQMNPHFIFNSLTSINKFILKSDTLAASDYLTRFSRLIRMVLNNSKRSFISLEDELDMLRLYLDMEKLRFKETFTYQIRIDEAVDPAAVFLPPLVFQPFVENAIWHGLMPRQRQGMLDIKLRKENDVLIIVITDNGVGRGVAGALTGKSARKQKSMGIDITKQRLSLVNGGGDADGLTIVDLFGPHGEPTGTRVIVRIKARTAVGEESYT